MPKTDAQRQTKRRDRLSELGKIVSFPLSQDTLINMEGIAEENPEWISLPLAEQRHHVVTGLVASHKQNEYNAWLVKEAVRVLKAQGHLGGTLEELLRSADMANVTEQSVPYEAGDNDEETIPGGVVDIRHGERVTLHKAWRLYRKMSLEAVAELLGITVEALEHIETLSVVHPITLQKLAVVYSCRVTQMY